MVLFCAIIPIYCYDKYDSLSSPFFNKNVSVIFKYSLYMCVFVSCLAVWVLWWDTNISTVKIRNH